MCRFVFALAAAAVLVPLVQPVGAADMPLAVKAPFVTPAYNWGGFYAGANLGWGRTSADWTNRANTTLFGDNVPPDRFSHSANGVIAGAQIGYNFQTGPWLLGTELLFDGARVEGTHASIVGAADDQFTGGIDALLLLTGRVGYAVNNWLAYVKGGYAGAIVRAAVSDAVVPTIGSGSDSQWRSGWTVGGGVEYGLTPNWSLAVEYNYVELESGRYEIGGGAGSYAWDVRPRGLHLMLAKLSYRFNTFP